MAGSENASGGFTYEVDGEEQHTTEKTLTAREILSLAGIDPETHYLVELHGEDQDSYEGKADATIHMHQHQRFVSIATGSTPVS